MPADISQEAGKSSGMHVGPASAAETRGVRRWFGHETEMCETCYFRPKVSVLNLANLLSRSDIRTRFVYNGFG